MPHGHDGGNKERLVAQFRDDDHGQGRHERVYEAQGHDGNVMRSLFGRGRVGKVGRDRRGLAAVVVVVVVQGQRADGCDGHRQQQQQHAEHGRFGRKRHGRRSSRSNPAAALWVARGGGGGGGHRRKRKKNIRTAQAKKAATNYERTSE